MKLLKFVIPAACGIILFAFDVNAANPWLTIGSTDSNNYGYSFNGVTSNIERADFNFTSNSKSLQLSVKGFDIDNASEVRVSINGRRIGELVVGSNNELETTQLLIPRSLLTGSANRLSFVQTVSGRRWGVTDISITDVPTLQLGVVDTVSYGHLYAGAVNRIKRVDFRMASKPAADTKLQVIGYDVDSSSEVSVLLNDALIGNLSSSVNNGFSNTSLTIPRTEYTSGENIISFENEKGKVRWGISDVEVTELPSQPSTNLSLGNVNEGKFGYSYDGILTNPKEVTFTFNNPQSGPLEVITLDVEGYDIDNPSEISVYVNDNLIGQLSESPNNGLLLTTLPIQTNVQVLGTNKIMFVQSNEGKRWGVTDILITAGCNYPLIVAN